MDAGTVTKIMRILDALPVETDSYLGAVTITECSAGITGAEPGAVAIFVAAEIQARRIEAEGRLLNFDEVAETIRRWTGTINFDEPFEEWREWRARARP